MGRNEISKFMEKKGWGGELKEKIVKQGELANEQPGGGRVKKINCRGTGNQTRQRLEKIKGKDYKI